MKFMKLLSPLVIVLMLATLWGCSGDTSATNATSSNQKKKLGKSLVDDLKVTSGDSNDKGLPSVAYCNYSVANIGRSPFLSVYTYSKTDGAVVIKGQLLNGSGTSTSSKVDLVKPVIDIAIDAGNKSQPKVAFDPITNKYLVVWVDAKNAGVDLDLGVDVVYAGSIIRGQFISDTGALLKKDGTPGLEPFDISTQNLSSYNQTEPDLAYNTPRKLFIASWLDSTNADTVHPSGTLTGTSCSNSTFFNYIPLPTSDTNLIRSIEIMPNNGTFKNPQDVSKILTTSPIIDDTNGKFTATWSLETNETKPRIVVAPSGDYFIAWSGINSSVTCSLDYKKGTPVAPLTIAPCTYGPVVFTSNPVDLTTKIKIRKNAGFGLFNDFTFGKTATSPSVAVDPDKNRLLIVWEEQALAASAFKAIQGQMIDLSNFTNYGSQIDISSGTTGDRSSPVVSFDNANQRFLTVWEDARNSSANISNMNIYAQFIDPQGQLSGGNAIVTVASGNQIAPAVVFGGQLFRQFLVVWKDGRVPGNSDIYGQLLEFSESPQLVVADKITDLPILSGSIDFGNVALGQTKDITLKLKNDGNKQLTINQDVLKTITPDKPYTLLTPMPVTISPATSYDLTIRFAPTAIGSYAGTSGNKFKLQIDSDGGQSVTYFSGAGTGSDPLAITTTALPDGTPGSAYSAKLDGFGGVFPYLSWSASGLPAGLSIDKDSGLISGVITSGVADYKVNISLTDNANTLVTKPLTIKVSSISITTTTLNSTTSGLFYTQTVATTGGTSPFAWTISGGTLPAGLAIDPLTGVISGIPTSSVTSNFTVNVTDSSGATSSKPLSIQVLQSSIDPGTTGNTGGTGGTTTGGGTVASSSSGGGSSSGCFIATAAYGSYLDPHVMVLRNFRDNVLLQSELGTSFVTFYYKYSPPLADFIAQHDLLRMIFRLALTPLIFAVKYPLVAVLLIAFAGIWFIRRKFSVKVKSEMAQQAG